MMWRLLCAYSELKLRKISGSGDQTSHVKTSCLWCQFHQRIFHNACRGGPGLCQPMPKNPKIKRAILPQTLWNLWITYQLRQTLWNQFCHVWFLLSLFLRARSACHLISYRLWVSMRNCRCAISGTLLNFSPLPAGR